MKTPLDQIKAAIYRVCKELTHTQAGCLLTDSNNGIHNARIIEVHENHLHWFEASIFTGSNEYKRMDFERKNVKITPPDLHLEHILRAIGAYNVSNGFSDHNLAQIKYYDGDQERFFSCDYDLTKSLEDQNPELHLFLAQLLVKE